MIYSENEVMQYVKEQDVKFIRLAFCDAFGNQKNVSIMPDGLERAFESGIGIDASAVAGFDTGVYSDLFLKPDPTTLSVLPWRPDHGRVVRMYCSVHHPDGTVFEADSRSLLKRAVRFAMDKGYSFSFGAELEFYLFKTDENGSPTKLPYDNAGYMDIAPMDKGENVRREICLTLEKMGIKPESSHHEEGPGQNEIDFRFSDPLTAADNAVTFKSVVKTIAARNGLYADFTPKPIADMPGNSFHINISARGLLNERDLSANIVAGIINRISDMTVFMNPDDESYMRLGRNKAPEYITWSPENRSQLIRIPAADGEYKRIELRSPDPMANPYIAYALLIYAGVCGIENNEFPPDAANINLFSASEEEKANYKKLPKSKTEAAEAAKSGSFIKEALPKEIINAYCR